MEMNPDHHRRSIRLKGYDYTQAGAYFVTIVVQKRECRLGTISGGGMNLNPSGRIVQSAWEDLPRHYPYVVLGEFCVMPNHVHGIIILTEEDAGRGGSETRPYKTRPYKTRPYKTRPYKTRPYKTRPYETCPYETCPYDPMKRHGLPEIVRALKSFSARRINQLHGDSGTAFWQRNYYEHIIRNEAELERISAYIRDNPSQWDQDTENPEVTSR